ncbi:hypothetical protein GCK72_019624 [Caenorhabditis remanei]|uniref:Uncharacterized protein n=1 Tax=Caenorhabditis remanei TaxID=31234 RepID=A0A6A5GD48_CAERE|nr:hypothetical protein GCK72_019624 [Caenorhabditis remanei]KAF1753068.1 hypothetical protein GCK72_019624 [Caenorhabditis remanei]
MSSCQVCNSPPASYHFGAITCRACAAFFRRYVNTKKSLIYCNCFMRKVDTYSCRFCRMEKCIAVGMQISQVQGPRDPNNQLKRKMMENPLSCEGLSIEHGIKLKNLELISRACNNYRNLELSRNTIFNRSENRINVELDLRDFASEIMLDVKLQYKFCELAFREFHNLTPQDKKVIFYNCCIRWNIFELSIYSTKYNNTTQFYSPSGAVTKPVREFYKSDPRVKLSGEEITEVFGPIWRFHFEKVIGPLVELKLDEVENMALFGLLLWDPGYANLSVELAERCHALRKMILRELKVYYEEHDTNPGRYFETLDSLNLIEKSEERCRREIELCGVYNIEIDQERRNMILWEKY